MNRKVKPPARPVIAEGPGELAGQRQLPVAREASRQRRGLAFRAQNRLAQRDKARAHAVEDRGNARRRRTGFVIVQKRVVGVTLAEPRRRQRQTLFAGQADHVAEDRQEMRHIVPCPRLGPDALRDARHPREFGGQAHRHGGAAVEIAADQVQHPGACRAGGGGARKPVGQTRIGAAAMQHRLHRGAFLAPLMGGAARHHGFLIPAEPSRDLRQRLRLALELHQAVEIGHARPLTD